MADADAVKVAEDLRVRHALLRHIQQVGRLRRHEVGLGGRKPRPIDLRVLVGLVATGGDADLAVLVDLEDGVRLLHTGTAQDYLWLRLRAGTADKHGLAFKLRQRVVELAGQLGVLVEVRQVRGSLVVQRKQDALLLVLLPLLGQLLLPRGLRIFQDIFLLIHALDVVLNVAEAELVQVDDTASLRRLDEDLLEPGVLLAQLANDPILHVFVDDGPVDDLLCAVRVP